MNDDWDGDGDDADDGNYILKVTTMMMIYYCIRHYSLGALTDVGEYHHTYDITLTLRHR